MELSDTTALLHLPLLTQGCRGASLAPQGGREGSSLELPWPGLLLWLLWLCPEGSTKPFLTVLCGTGSSCGLWLLG